MLWSIAGYSNGSVHIGVYCRGRHFPGANQVIFGRDILVERVARGRPEASRG
jgi:hypothetical protein